MMELREIERLDGIGLYVCQTGREFCTPLHQYGPAVRDHILLHFVASGRGTFYARGIRYAVGPGQGFAIFPDQITTYRADKQEPWRYYWAGYAGSDAEMVSRLVGLSRDAPIFEYAGIERMVALVERMRSDAAELKFGAMAALGGLYQLLALIGERQMPVPTRAAQSYCEKALWFMQGNYSRSISIEDVADYIGLSRSQLFRAFQREMGQGPKACLTQIRVKRALALIQDEDLTLEQIAASVGISSGARLNALLRESVHMSAGQYRRVRKSAANDHGAL